MGINTRFLKGVLLALLGLAFVITIISLLMPSTVMVSRSITTAADQQTVMQNISCIDKWKNWFPLIQNKDVAVEDLTETKAALKVADRMLFITKERADSNSITFTLIQPGQFPITTVLAVKPMQDELQRTIEWTSIHRLKWSPWEKFGGIFLNETAGKGYQEALEGLKKYLGK